MIDSGELKKTEMVSYEIISEDTRIETQKKRKQFRNLNR